MHHREDIKQRGDPVIFAYDIETTKKPLKFPDSANDPIMMISYMINGMGFLIVNRDIVSEDIEEIEYSPSTQYKGFFKIFNEPSEHIQEQKPTIIVTYNGDNFDWPYVEGRASKYGINMYKVNKARMKILNTNSYLPVGSQGLKSVTQAKLGYNPDELDPENPHTLARYSVSDAVATYYLYTEYIHPFIFSLCNIIPLNPDDILRKGTGTLCEALLMVEAYRANIIMPNKHEENDEMFFKDHLLQDETYIGGHVDALEAGVFRSDIPVSFDIDLAAIQQLIDDIDVALEFAIWETFKETERNIESAFNMRDQSLKQREQPLEQTPLIYHLDVAAMYPNIILTNRLQPDSIVTEDVCLRCDYNVPGKKCDRRMTWSWRGDFYPAKTNEYKMIKKQLMSETFPGKNPGDKGRSYYLLSLEEQTAILKKRLGDYCQTVYKRKKETEVEQREAIVCQRENPFYVNTVLSFRDRRYKYKHDVKEWKKKLAEATKYEDLVKIEEAKKMIILYDSLQLAHKCLLNSFYGYVMRKGSRWYSMEMAGIVCDTGAKIIQTARQLIEKVGRPLELDTDGIWCVLPSTFPENVTFKLSSGKTFSISYPCTMLNYLVHQKFTNDQYQRLSNITNEYEIGKENSIFFEVDGPYRAMILPSSLEENKLLKKRYAVFAHDGTLQELKGFEVKRRGELKLLKNFQEVIFQVFLRGKTLHDCYAEVGKVANAFLDVLEQKGATLSDEELIDSISEKRGMSRALEDYGDQKSTSITAAKRLAEFLGTEMVKDNKLTCHFIVSAKPLGEAISERVIPIAIFSAEENVKRHYLRKWLKDPRMDNFDIRNILDWTYYYERLGSAIQKLITIPATAQNVENPIPRLKHPDWLRKKLAINSDKNRQRRITDMFRRTDDMVVDEINYENRTEDMVVDEINYENDESRNTDNIDTGLSHNDPSNDINDINDIDDIEDFGTSNSNVSIPNYKKRPIEKSCSDEPAQEEELMVIDEPQHDGDDDTEIVDNPSSKRQKVDEDKNQKTVVTTKKKKDKNSAKKSTLENFCGQKNRWEILQISNTDTPGEFRMWVLIGQAIHAIRLAVPKKVYINYKLQNLPDEIEKIVNDKGSISRVSRTLPGTHERYNLFEVIMPEPIYWQNQKLLLNIFNDPLVEGVYETRITSLDRALIEIGCIISKDSVKSNIFKTAPRKGMNLQDIIKSEVFHKTPYLEEYSVNYLYLCHIMSGDRHLYGLFSTVRNKAHIFLVEKSKVKSHLPHLPNAYANILERMRNDPRYDNEVFKYHQELSFEVSTHVRDDKKTFAKKLSREIKEYKEGRHGPTILVVQSSFTLCNLIEEGVKALLEFPSMYINLNENDDLPSLNWQRYAFSRMITKYLIVGQIITQRIKKARYARIPLCNLNNDSSIFISDVLFARRLIKNDIILWWSPYRKPDHGGREQDEFFEYLHLSGEIGNCGFVNTPGIHMNICFEIQLDDLFVNTIIESSWINQSEGSIQLFGDEMPMPTFSVLKSLVKDWYTEASNPQNEIASILIRNLQIWLSAVNSNFYDHNICGVIHTLMSKVVMQLIAEFRNSGVEIVYSNLYKMIIATNKSELNVANQYRDFILRYIKQKPIFQALKIICKKTWANVIWLDSNNFCGTLCHVEDQFENHWKIKNYLPQTLYELFDSFVEEFVELCKENVMMGSINFKAIRHQLEKKIYDIVAMVQEDCGEGLKFTNVICAIFQSSLGESETRILRQNCCRLLKVSPYSEEAKFKLNDQKKIGKIECSCGLVQPIDVTLPKCINCEETFRLEQLEYSLLEAINEQVGSYQDQDLYCSKCNLPQQKNFFQECTCGGEYKQTVSREKFISIIISIEKLAKENEMKLLLETCEWLLNK
ncbi:11654_t:CDS:2 [Racocetra fulgida]|uniref:DNA polymerase epsilon catalytic subunit n=1 Tax=Racocetra fulgida TaxID=60492 RepID=A0A9N8WDF5_9GLOM|nr:11654_t:CDS:2 [Racocetra fulgida]